MRQEIYAIVNYHRSREGSAYVLMLAGTSVAGTEAAADFVLDDLKLLPFPQKAERDGRIRDFDLLLHGRNLAGTAPRAPPIALYVGE